MWKSVKQQSNRVLVELPSVGILRLLMAVRGFGAIGQIANALLRMGLLAAKTLCVETSGT